MKLGTRKERWKICPDTNYLTEPKVCKECKKAKHCEAPFTVRKIKVLKISKSPSKDESKYHRCPETNLLVTKEKCKECEKDCRYKSKITW